MLDTEARKLQAQVTHRKDCECFSCQQAWEKLHEAFRPMMYRLVPPWVPEADRDDWMSDLYEHMMRGVLKYNPSRSDVKLSTFVFGCMRMAQQHLVEKHNTHKRAMLRVGGACGNCGKWSDRLRAWLAAGTVERYDKHGHFVEERNCATCSGTGRVAGSTSLYAPVSTSDGGDAGDLVEFLVDTKVTDPEQWAMFAELLSDVDNILEPVQVPIWRWLVDMQGDVNAVARWLHLPVREVRETLLTVRRYLRETRVQGDPFVFSAA